MILLSVLQDLLVPLAHLVPQDSADLVLEGPPALLELLGLHLRMEQVGEGNGKSSWLHGSFWSGRPDELFIVYLYTNIPGPPGPPGPPGSPGYGGLVSEAVFVKEIHL